MTEPLTDEELKEYRASVWVSLTLRDRLLATIDADRKRIRRLEWLVGEKHSGLAGLVSLHNPLGSDPCTCKGCRALAFTVDDAPEVKQ